MTSAIVQARMGSTRLPGKVMKDLAGQPMIAHIIRRVQAARRIEQVILATTDHAADDALAEFVESLGVPVFRGSESDVLDRYYHAAKAHGAEVIVRITGDCPVIDPGVIDQTIGLFRSDSYDYVNNFMQRTFPDGLDTEIFTFAALETAWREAKQESEREHVTPFLYHHPERFRMAGLVHPVNIGFYRWTVDNSDDLEFVSQLYEGLYTENPNFDMEAVLQFLKQTPEFND